MGTRTVRLDDDTERTLQRLRRCTGLSISEVLKRGVQAYAESAGKSDVEQPYDVYRRIELGEGGWSAAPGRQAKKSVRELIERRHRR